MITRQSERITNILLVEDNEGDTLLITEALQQANIPHRLQVVTDGFKALESLKDQNGRPGLIILDINLPKKNGLEVLQTIRGNPAWQHLPIIILTSSNRPSDILKCYQSFANCFITKPIRLQDFMNVLQEMIRFWLKIVQLPMLN